MKWGAGAYGCLPECDKKALRNGLNRCNRAALFEDAPTLGDWPADVMVMT